MSDETTETTEERKTVRAFQIGIEPMGNMVGAYLLPPDGREPDGEEKVLLAAVRQIIFAEPGMREAFNAFLKAIALAMVSRHVDAETAATMKTTVEDV